MHIAELETEMIRRGMFFEEIDWSSATSGSAPKPQETNAVDGPTHLSARIAGLMRIRKH
jgi:hypothetical protein